MRIWGKIYGFCVKKSKKYRAFGYVINLYLRYVSRRDPHGLANKVYRKVFNKDIDWNNPKNLIEKIYWLQLYSDTTLWSICADKYRIREYLRLKGVEYLLPDLYGHWFKSRDIDFDKLPNSFVLKTTNGCGQVLIVKDKSKLDIKKTRALLDHWLLFRYGFDDAQIHYTRIQPSIIAEEFLIDGNNVSNSIIDYKFWCLNGKVEYILCAFDRVILGEDRDYKLAAFDRDWNDISNICLKIHKLKNVKIKRPKHLEEMIKYAEFISQDFIEVRVDFYDTSNRIYLGEITFSSGYGSHKEEFYEYLGSKIDLSKVKVLKEINRPDIAKL